MTIRFLHPTFKPAPSGYKLLNAHRGAWSRIFISHDDEVVLKRSIEYQEGPQLTDAHRRRAKDSLMFLEREMAIYQHLGSHPDILEVRGVLEDGLLFPYLRKGPLRACLQTEPFVSRAQREQWVYTAVRSLAFVHAKDVLVGDISTRNFLVADDDAIVLSDFSGSGLCGFQSMLQPDCRYASGHNQAVSMSTEVFAIGSLIYEIVTGVEPYAELAEEEVATNFRSDRFPATADLMFGEIIHGCWNGHFATSSDVLHAITTRDVDNV